MKVFLIFKDTWSDGGYDHHTEITGVYQSETLAKYKMPESHRSEDYNEQYKIVEYTVQDGKSLIEKLKKDLEDLEK